MRFFFLDLKNLYSLKINLNFLSTFFSARIKTMNLDSSEASEQEGTPKRGRRSRLEEKKLDDSNVTVNRRKRKPASSQSSQESDTGSVSSRRSSSRISSQKTESPKKVKAPTKKQKTAAKPSARR